MFFLRISVMKSSMITRNSCQKLISSIHLSKKLSNLAINNPESYRVFKYNSLINWNKNCIATFSTDAHVEPVNPDVFGSISGNKFEAEELDEDEQEQENFELEESRLPRRKRLSTGQYVKLIEEHLNKGDLYSAMNVLELIKQNRDKPTRHMYNLLIRGFAMQGNLKKCFKLFNNMKKRALKPNEATYTSIFNACATTSDREYALEILNHTRQEMLQKNVVFDPTHYNVMIKAYGVHGCLIEAFQLVDEMVDKKLPTDIITFNSLMFASISDKSNGLRHAVTVWHLMLQRRIKPGLMTYHLLLRAIRDTGFGDLKISDTIVPKIPATKINLVDEGDPDLLARPPVITHLAINSLLPPAPPKTQENNYVSESALQVQEDALVKKPLQQSNDLKLHELFAMNRMTLFGGYTGFLERMERDGVTPDLKTLTYMLDVSAPSTSIENHLIKIARKKRIPLDITFFNMLIKKRCKRKDYKLAKRTVHEIQMEGLIPNIITWGVLAMTCNSHDEGLALIEGMEATGHTLNPVIATNLLHKGCSTYNFKYIFDIMNIMQKNRVTPTDYTYEVLNKFQKALSDIVHKKVRSKHSNDDRYINFHTKFNLRYDTWKKFFGRDEQNIRMKKKT